MNNWYWEYNRRKVDEVMCEYCRTGKRIKNVDAFDIENGAYAFVDDDDKELSIAIERIDSLNNDIDELYINIPINYCPMCGRKFK